jgi:hypothetical protein
VAPRFGRRLGFAASQEPASGFLVSAKEPHIAEPQEAKNMAKTQGAKPMTIKFIPNDKSGQNGKLADAELLFSGGPLDGLKLVGFAVWERRTGGRAVTFPSRQYTVQGERRSYAQLRPVADPQATERIRDLILNAYREHEAALAESA